MAKSPFSEYNKQSEPVYDATQITNAGQTALAGGITTAATAIAERMKADRERKYKEEEAEKDREIKRRELEEKLKENYLKRQQDDLERKIKGKESAYNRNKDRLDTINAQLAGMSGSENKTPAELEMARGLQEKANRVIQDMERQSTEIEDYYRGSEDINSFTAKSSGQKEDADIVGRYLQEAASTSDLSKSDPLSAARRADGSIDPSRVNTTRIEGAAMPAGKGSNLYNYGSNPSDSPIFQEGRSGGDAGLGPKFRPEGTGRTANYSGARTSPSDPIPSPGAYTNGTFNGGIAGSGYGSGGSGSGSSQGGYGSSGGGYQEGGSIDRGSGYGLRQVSRGTAGTGLADQAVEYQPIGSNPLITDISSKYPNANVSEDTMPVNGVAGGRIGVKDGPDGRKQFQLLVAPDATPERSGGTLDGLARIVTAKNNLNSDEIASISGLLTPEAQASSLSLYKELRQSGAIPAELDFPSFQAAAAASLYGRDSTALGELSPEQGVILGRLSARSGTAVPATVPSVARPATTTENKIEIVPETPATVWQPAPVNNELDTNRVQRLLRSGVPLNSPGVKAVMSTFKHLDDQALAKQRLLLSQQNAASAMVTASAARTKSEREQSVYSGNLESLLPGIGHSVGGADTLHYNRTLNQPRNVDLGKEFRRIEQIGGSAAAWQALTGSYGFNEKLEQDRYQNAQTATEQFDKGFTASMTIQRLFESQQGKDWATLTYDRLVGDQPAVAAQYRLFLMGAFRKQTVGLGNPSNFEQELLLNLIPDPTNPFQITSRSIAKSRMLTLMTMAAHMNEMESNKWVISSETAKEYSKRLRQAGMLGAKQELSIDQLREFRSILRDDAGNPADSIQKLRVWARQTGSPGMESIINQATDGEFVRGGTTKALQRERDLTGILTQLEGPGTRSIMPTLTR